MARTAHLLLFAALGNAALGQTAYPELTIQDVTWNSGTHHYAVTNHILSPGSPDLPVTISGTADAEFVSASQVRLLPGFHAGDFEGAGQFHAHIDQNLGSHADLVIISPAPDGSSPYGSIQDNVLHVHKWEKVEVGLRLPQVYQDAIERFFANYYSDGVSDFATPGNVDAAHDLNPYADDSLQLVMTLTRPDGSQTMKWGFFMREGGWTSADDEAELAPPDPGTNLLVPYHARFRFAPDAVGEWQFGITIKAPHTYATTGVQLPAAQFTGYQLICEPPLADNNGHLEVNPNNRRLLRFEGDEMVDGDEIPFLGLGTNMGHNRLDIPDAYDPFKLHKRDLRFMTESLGILHDVGGNFIRAFMLNLSFAPEMVNLGVYDAFKVPQICDLNYPPTICGNGGWMTNMVGNCQYQCWAFDQLLNSARENSIYIQLCIDPYPPVVDYERFLWGTHPHVDAYLEPYRDTPVNGNPWDLKRFFYSNLDPNDTQSARVYDSGAFYYWKRKYKYIMSRWGWSVNIPIIEPFNEIDQILSYSHQQLSINPASDDPCSANGALCEENKVDWAEDTFLPGAVSDWFSDIAAYVRGEQVWDHPESSPLGEEKKLFLASYAGGKPTDAGALSYYAPFSDPAVDIMDVHRGLHNAQDLRVYNAHAEGYRDLFEVGGMSKPFNSGEFNHYAKAVYNDEEFELSPYFHNYEIAFHNELWSSAFSGKFAAGTTWHWDRVFWWEDTQEAPPPDEANDFYWSPSQQFANAVGEINEIEVNELPYQVENRTLYHNFKPLADLLNHPSWTAYDFFSQAYKVRRNEDFTDFEAYYLQNDVPNEQSTVAIGWVRNRNSSILNSYYLASSAQQFFSCTAPDPTTSEYLYMPGFVPGLYYVTWFPTRLNSTVHPPDGPVSTSFTGAISLDLRDQFGGIDNDYLDTLRGDYAFIITPEPFVKSLPHPPAAVDANAEAGWDFAVYPNPTREGFNLKFQDDAPKEVMILDISGRVIVHKPGVAAPTLQFPERTLAQGAYWIRVSDGRHHKTKKLILQ